MSLGKSGLATVAAVTALASVAVGSIGTPMAVDSFADQSPDSSLYALERAGETIKESTYTGGMDWDLDRSMERTREYESIVNDNIPGNRNQLIEEAQERYMNAARKSSQGNDLEKVNSTINRHKKVLENVLQKVPENAKPAIERAIVRSQWQNRVIENIQKNIGQGGLPSGIKKKIDEEMTELDNVRKILENRKISPGIMKKILENKDITLDNIKNFVKGKNISRGITKELFKNGKNPENLGLPKDIKIPQIGPPDNIGPPENTGPPENPDNRKKPDNVPPEKNNDKEETPPDENKNNSERSETD